MTAGRTGTRPGKEDKEWARPTSGSGWWALTGTPGTGKSSTARALGAEPIALEVPWIAAAAGALRDRRSGREVDLVRLGRYLTRRPVPGPALIVGHLAHRLPVQGAIVLRCHPGELTRRLARRRPVEPPIATNAIAEAIDLVAGEAHRRLRRVVEIDTTHRAPTGVARRVRAALAGDPRSDRVDWLADPAVTDRIADTA